MKFIVTFLYFLWKLNIIRKGHISLVSFEITKK